MSEKIKNCPFCGQQPKETKYREFGKNPREYFLYHCPNEECPSYFTKPGSMTAEDWDNRPIEDALNARIAELEGAIKTDDERLIRAGLTVGLYSGCDTAETMAEAILASREHAERAEQMVEKLVGLGSTLIDATSVALYPNECKEWFDAEDEWYGAQQ